MGLKKVFLLFSGILLIALNLSRAQNTTDPFLPSTAYSDRADGDRLDIIADAEQLISLRARLRQIESMLLAQKDRENELLRDLNKMMLTTQDQSDEAEIETKKGLEDAEKMFRAESAILEAKIHSLELALAAGHERDLQMGQQMNQTVLITVSTVAGIGLLVFLVTVYLQYRLISRPIQPFYMQPQALAIEAGRPQLPVVEEKHSVGNQSGLVENSKVEDTNELFLSAIERLEARIKHMEEGISATETELNTSGSDEGVSNIEGVFEESSEELGIPEESFADEDAINQEVESFTSGTTNESPTISDDPLAETDEMDVAVLEEEGKRFLQKEDWETAFQYYDQLVRLDNLREDNWVNRGRALEMLKREEEAIASYDNAIEANPELPSPFLYKAALLSRMERFEEAQKFYNAALSKVPVQKKEQASVS
jgi:tetratricopeptide (TPR) repeat protein